MAKETWKLHTINENVWPAIQSFEEYPSKDEALDAACDEVKKPHIGVFIEGSNGEKIDYGEILKLCHSRTA